MENERSIKWIRPHYDGKEEILEVYIFNYLVIYIKKELKYHLLKKLEMKKNLIVIRI